MRAGAHGIACEGVHVRARVEASRLACLKRLDSGRVWLRGADALCIQHAYVHAVAGGALVELRQHRAFRLRPRDHEDPANLQRDAAFRAVRAQLPVALDAEARLRRAGLDVVARMHDPRVAPALVKRRAGLLLEDHHAAPRAGQVPRDARANSASPDDDDVDSRHPLPSALPSFPLPDDPQDARHRPDAVERVLHRLLGFYGSRARAVKQAGGVASAEPVCPGTATLTVFVENLSGAPTIAVELDGELAADAATCAGSGATSYRETMTCTGSGVVRCGQLAALQPGTWVHRLSVTVPGSATQQQAQRLVLVAGSSAEVSNALVWTVYPQTFVVQAASAAELQARLDEATAYTRENAGPALVTFSADAFPGATAPQRIYLLQPPCSLDVTHNRCSPDGTWDGWTAGVCFLGDRIGVRSE